MARRALSDLRKTPFRRRPAVLAGVGLVALGLAMTTSVRVTASPGRQTLPGTGAPGLAGTTRLGNLDPASHLSVAVTLPLRNQAGLRQFIAAVSTPSSPLYGRYLTPQQFAAGYGPTSAQAATVSGYLTSQGLHIDQVASNNEIIDTSGTVAAMKSAFGTSLGRYHDAALGRDFFANDGPATVPVSVASLIAGVAGLDDHYPLRHHGVADTPHLGGGPAGGYTPAQLKTAYDVNPLASASYTGAGQHVGLFELDGFQQSNITTYDNQYSLGSPAPSVVAVDGGTPLGSGQNEVELDIEVIQAIAPAASITVWEGPNTNQGVIDTYNAMVTSNTTATNSTSWGLCEPLSSSSVITSEDSIFQQAAAQGQSFFAASGDNGAFDCATAQLAVDNPADDPYITGAGGSTLYLNGSNGYSSEGAWATPSRSLGSGGGLSRVFARPSWQTGPGVQNSFSNGTRQVPDVASDADPATGVSIYSKGAWTVFGGTSAAAPSWAAFAALYNQDAAANGKPHLGYANPALYQLAGGSQAFPAFHDLTTGDNLYYNATPGWDYASGWGSYDANNVARDLIGGTPSPTESRNDCILIGAATTGQTLCPTPVTLTNSGNVVLTTNGGGFSSTCTFWFSTLAPVFVSGQGLGSFHLQIPQFNDTASAGDSAKSSGSGSTVTYTANTITDTSNIFPASFVGKLIQSKFSTGTVVGGAGTNTLTLAANWSPGQPSNGDPYQVAPCTDSAAGHDQFVNVNGWGVTFVDASNDEVSLEGSGTTGDALTVNIPAAGAVV
ncbi:MAG: hypothetical protein E6I33_11330, partial [Chloroflexi bacterium]